MFDTMTVTKILGGLCGALLFFLMGNWAATALYSMGGGGHGEDHAAYVIETEEGDDHGDAVEQEGPSLEDLLAEADVGKGAKVFKKCAACHKIEDGVNATGPYLYGVVGRDVGAADGFGNYSGSLSAVADVWTAENLNDFLVKPKSFAPGTTMSFPGLKKLQDRTNLIAYLDSLDN